MRKNNSGTRTSGSHNFFVQTPIRTNFISLEIRHRELSEDMMYDLFWILEDLQNHPRNLGQKTVRAQKSRRIRKGGCVADKIATWREVRFARHHHAPRGTTPPIKETPPPSFQVWFARALGLLERSLGKNRGLGVYLRGFLGSFESERLLSRYSLSLSSFSLLFSLFFSLF